MKRENQKLKDFLYAHLYSNQNVNSERRRLTGCIRSLFRYYLKHPQSLPAFYYRGSRSRSRAPGGLRLHRRHDGPLPARTAPEAAGRIRIP